MNALFLHQPNFGHLAAAAAAASAWFLRPGQVELSFAGGALGDVEFDGAERIFLWPIGMNFDALVGHEPKACLEIIAGIDDSDFILRFGIEIGGSGGGKWCVNVDGTNVGIEEAATTDCDPVFEFEPNDFVLTTYQRKRGGVARGDAAMAERIRDLLFKI